MNQRSRLRLPPVGPLASGPPGAARLQPGAETPAMGAMDAYGKVVRGMQPDPAVVIVTSAKVSCVFMCSFARYADVGSFLDLQPLRTLVPLLQAVTSTDEYLPQLPQFLEAAIESALISSRSKAHAMGCKITALHRCLWRRTSCLMRQRMRPAPGCRGGSRAAASGPPVHCSSLGSHPVRAHVQTSPRLLQEVLL